MVTSSSRAVLISGRWPRGNSTSITGPAMPTMRPSFRAGVSVPVLDSVTVIGALLWGRGSRGPAVGVKIGVLGEQVGGHQVVREHVVLTGAGLAEGLAPLTISMISVV